MLFVAVVSAEANQIFIRVQNNTGFTIRSIFVRPAGSSQWGSNRMSGTLSSGRYFDVRGLRPGRYDIAVQDTDGDWYRKRNWGLNSGGSFTATFTLSDIDP